MVFFKGLTPCGVVNKISFRNYVLIFIDALLVMASLYLALLIRFEGAIPFQYIDSFFRYTLLFTFIRIACFYFSGLYNRLWEYASIGELVLVISSVTLGSAINIAIAYFLIKNGQLIFPRSVFLLSWLLNIFLIGGSRLSWRLFRDNALKNHMSIGNKPILIIGAGDTGVLVAKELKRHYNGEIRIIGFIDDDPKKQALKVLNLPVLGGREDIPEIVRKYGVEEIILAIPSVSGKIVREVVEMCHYINVKLKILPGVFDLIEENVTVSNIRDVQVEDLLGREPVKVCLESISGYLGEKIVLVTGAGGSIGSELCRQIVQFQPQKLLLIENSENNMYDIEMELKSLNPHIEIVPFVKDIRDRKAIDKIFAEYKPQVVYHAAAHKHVPLMEANPEEAIKNNVMGTYNVALACDKFRAEKFVLISTDKAVNPTSIMGASKRLAETIIQYLNKKSRTDYAAVRFGNVLGSRGSVIPLFKKQIAAGGPVTVTHPDMVRYFMTIPEAVQLVIQAGSIAKGGEVFVLDMGEPVKIVDLARGLIRLSGLEPERDIEIIFTGIRPGEKLFEELLTAEEGTTSTSHKRISVAKPGEINSALTQDLIANIELQTLPRNMDETVELIRLFIPQFRQASSIEREKKIIQQIKQNNEYEHKVLNEKANFILHKRGISKIKNIGSNQN